MKIGFSTVLFLLCLNLVCGLMYALTVPGTEYSHALMGTGNASDYQERFDPEGMMNATQPGIIGDLPYLGNIYAAIMYLWNAVAFIIAGFPLMLYQWAGAIPSYAARTAYLTIITPVIAIFYFLILGWLFQVFTGRQTQD